MSLANKPDWISKAELLQLTGWTSRTVLRKQKSGDLKTRAALAGRNGKARREYDANSLPPELQAKRLQQALSAPITKSPAPGGSLMVRTLASLEPAAQAQATERLEIIRPMIDFLNSGQKPLLIGPGQQHASLSAIVKHIAEAAVRSERTLWNWWNAYKDGGPGALADKTRSDRNVSRFFKDHKEAALFASNKFLNERLNLTLVHEALLREWKRLRLGPDDEPPSYKTTRLFLNGLPPIIAAVSRDGDRAYKENFAPFLLRDRSKLRSNQYWVSDHMLHDVWVRNFDARKSGPLFGELPVNAAFRPWLTAIQDMKSRRILGMVWCATPSSNTISSALRAALERYGRPESAFYVDNGKDYQKVSDDARGVLTRLGITTQHCTPRHPQAKPIEGFFHIFHQRFDVIWRPFYAGTSPIHRPEECDRVRQHHERLLRAGRGDKSPLPIASEFIELASQSLEDFNHTFVDKRAGMGARTPVQIFDADLPPEKREVLKAADLAQLFWNRERRTVREGGTVQLFNARYEPADAASCAALTLNIQREILVACDPLSAGEAIALSLDETFLGVLRAQDLLVHGETPVDAIRASMRERRNVLKAVKRYTAAIAQSRIVAGDESEIQVLARRAAGAAAPPVYSLPLPKAVNATARPRLHVDDIAAGYYEEE